MNRTYLSRQTTENDRRDAWDELLLRRVLHANSPAEPSTDERWRRISGRVAAYEQLGSLHHAMALHGAELRRILVLSRPWPSLQAFFG